MTVVNIEDLRRRARRRLPKVVFDFIDGGAQDEVSLRANRADFEAWELLPKMLVDVSQRTITSERTRIAQGCPATVMRSRRSPLRSEPMISTTKT